MFGKLFLLFAILPIIEIALLVNVGEQIGGWNTVGLVIITAFIGAWLVRQQGLSTLIEAQRRMQTGEIPGQQMAEGLLLVVAGVLLVTPGFITDGIGFLLSMPLTRPVIARSLLKHMQVNVIRQQGQAGFGQTWHSHQADAQPRSPDERDSSVIEGEYVDKSDQSAQLENDDANRRGR